MRTLLFVGFFIGMLALSMRTDARVLVIDPGHGGRDHGARGYYMQGTTKKWVREKDLTLELGSQLKRELERRGSRIQVVMTREEDRFITLKDRGMVARNSKASLFLSLHANSADGTRFSGFETYILNNATGTYESRLARLENEATGETLSNLDFILSDLVIQSNVEASLDFARQVQENVTRSFNQRGYRIRNRGIKQALFSVLFFANTPGALVESGFLNNPSEAARLNDPRYQAGLIGGMADAVVQWFSRHHPTPTRVVEEPSPTVISYSSTL